MKSDIAFHIGKQGRESQENSPRAGAVEDRTGARGGGPHKVVGARSSVVEGRTGARGGGPHKARRGLRCHGGGLMRRGRRIGGGARKKREKGRWCSTRKKRRGSICARHWRLYTREIYSRCQPPAGSKGPLLPVRVINREVGNTHREQRFFCGRPRNCSPPLLPGGLPTRE